MPTTSGPDEGTTTSGDVEDPTSSGPSTGIATTEGTSTGSTSTGSTSTGPDSSSSGGVEPFCGDGVVDGGEACDDGNQVDVDHCLSSCVVATCGDGQVEAGVEACDDGNQVDDDACTNSCGSASCGDGIVQNGEACDAGAQNSNTGACTLACFKPVCGDGFVQPGNGEGCDDKNGDDLDACPGTCEPAVCGDGFVRAGVETCDDGNLLDTDACTAACEAAVCGDGLVQAGVEQCDSSGMATLLCDPDCSAAKCGDGFINAPAGELCDDGNLVPGDGCESDCKLEVMVATGLRHTCVRLSTGDARCWGNNAGGQLGNNSKTTLGPVMGDLPVKNINFKGLKAREIVAGGSHSCALMATGGLKCWGTFEALGYPPMGGFLLPPAADIIVGAPVQHVVAGTGYTCVLTESGGVRCWGVGDIGSAGHLGTGNKLSIGTMVGDLPVPDIELGGAAVQISAGSHVCAVLAGGAVKCWGGNTYGELGLGHTNDIGDQPGEMPPAAVELGGPAVQVAAGADHSCALLADGKVRCWGYNVNGRLGVGHKLNLGDEPGEMPPPVANVGGTAIQIAVGNYTSCALLDTGKVRCWGTRSYLGMGPSNYNSFVGDEPGEMPPLDAQLGGVAVKLAVAGASSDHMCALMDDAKLQCWGYNEGCGLPLAKSGTFVGDNETPASLGPVPY